MAMLGLAPNASAQAQAKASYDAFRYQIIDLNPDDGIEPGINVFVESVNAWALLRDENGVVRESAQAGSVGGPVQVLIDTEDAHLAGNAIASSASSLVYIEKGIGETFNDSFLGFILAPYTQVTFSIDALVSTSMANVPGLSANVAMNGRIRDQNGNFTIVSDSLNSYLGSADTLSITLGSGAAELTGTLELATAAFAQVQAIPEPAPMAMLAAGVAVIGGVARRRASRNPCAHGACS